MTYNVFGGTLSLPQSIYCIFMLYFRVAVMCE